MYSEFTKLQGAIHDFITNLKQEERRIFKLKKNVIKLAYVQIE